MFKINGLQNIFVWKMREMLNGRNGRKHAALKKKKKKKLYIIRPSFPEMDRRDNIDTHAVREKKKKKSIRCKTSQKAHWRNRSKNGTKLPSSRHTSGQLGSVRRGFNTEGVKFAFKRRVVTRCQRTNSIFFQFRQMATGGRGGGDLASSDFFPSTV